MCQLGSFRKMFFIGQNLKHVYMTYSFLEFWCSFNCLVGVYSLGFISHHNTEILYVNTNTKGDQSWNKKKTFSLVSLRWRAWLVWNCFFMDWFYYDLIILIKLGETQYRNLGKALLFRESRSFVWKTENFDELTLP